MQAEAHTEDALLPRPEDRGIRAVFQMNRTNIEWTDFTWNPVTGCRHDCDYCYARATAQRFSQHFPHGFEPWFYPERLAEPQRVKKPAKIFVCSMADLFGDWVPDEWIAQVFDAVRAAPRHTFQFLTKNPYRYQTLDLPERGWYGATIDSPAVVHRLLDLCDLPNVRGYRRIRFASFEPLTGPFAEADLDALRGIQWAVIGGRSAANGLPAVVPERAWIQTIIDAARRGGAAVFVKNNAGGTTAGWPQEFPEVCP